MTSVIQIQRPVKMDTIHNALTDGIEIVTYRKEMALDVTAFGKTVVCCNMIARKGLSTLILVDKVDLMNQWIKRLEDFLEINEELPEYRTKTGRTRNRDYDGKKNVIVYDYVDSHVPKFDKMYASRLKAYKKIGYEFCVNMDGEKQKANAIYDIDNYAETYWRDLEEAKRAVIDNEIVWYGSMNLLSKEDADDNLMRVCSKGIAAELMEMAFGDEADMQVW